MSRKASIPIKLPKGVEVQCSENNVTVKGPKGTLLQTVHQGISITIEDGKVLVTRDELSQCEPQMLGLYWSLVANMVKGVSEGFEKRLEMIGVGYRAAVQGRLLDLQIGCSHPTKIEIPAGIDVAVEKNTLIQIKGIDKRVVGQFAADVRGKKPPEPYKGKGIRYSNEFVRRKAGKTGKK